MLVRHDAEIRLIVECKKFHPETPCVDRIIPARSLNTYLDIQSYLHGKVSGMDSGVQVKYTYNLVNPERDVLKDGTLCPCDECEISARALSHETERTVSQQI